MAFVSSGKEGRKNKREFVLFLKMKTFVCWIMRPFQRWWGDLCVCFCFLCVCCFASGFTFFEMLSRKKKLRTKLL